MNSSSFIYFYLHLANQKTRFSLILNDHVSLKFSSQPPYARQSLALLSLKGLKKKSDLFNEAAFTAWKQALGYPSLMSLPFFSLHQLYQLNLKYKALTRFQNLNFSKKKPKSTTGENFFSIARKSNEKAALLPFSLISNLKLKQLTLPLCFVNNQSVKTQMLDKVKTKKKLISTLYQKILNQSFKKNFVDHLTKIESLTKIKTYEKPKLLNPTNFVDKNFYFSKYSSSSSLNNQAITLQSTLLGQHKEHFVWGAVSAKSGQSRPDHQMEFFSWTPTLDKAEAYLNVSKAATFSHLGKNFYKIQRAQEDEFKKEKAPTFGFPPQLFCLSKKFWFSKNRAINKHPKESKVINIEKNTTAFCLKNKNQNFSTFKPCLTVTQQQRANTKTKKVNTSLVDYNKNLNPPFENSMMLSKLSLNNPVQKKKLKTFFDFFQLEAGKVKQDLSTRYICASWLLEYIRAELSFRNANLKRVLNNLFLYTQQPICHLTPSKQAVPFALPFQRSSEKANSVFVNTKDSLFIVPDIIKGLRVTFSGRLGGKKGMAKTLTKTTGRVPFSTLKEKIDFAKGVVHTKNGSLGIKVWICFN